MRVPLPLALLRNGPTLAALARALPNRFRLVDTEGEVGGATLRRQVRDLAAAWAAAGMGPGQRWGVLAGGRPAVLGLLAAATTGADVAVLDPHAPDLLLRTMIGENSMDGLVVVDREHELGVRQVVIDSSPGPDRAVARCAGGRTLLLSSGTSGRPTLSGRTRYGVRALGPALDLARRVATFRSPLLLTPPLHHGYGLGFLTLALVTGSPVVLGQGADPETLLAMLRRHRVRTLVTVPPTLNRLVGGPRLENISLSAIVTGSGPLHPSLAEEVMDSFGDILHNLYGTTEAGWCCLATPADLRAAPGTVGRPVWGTRARIINGEVFIASPLATRSETIFVPTGDLGHRDPQGRLHLHGRRDDIVVVGGVNVDLTTVEAHLRAHPEVRDVIVDAIPDPALGHRLLARVVPGTRPPDADELTRYAAARLPPAAVPRRWAFVDAVDRTPFGSPRRHHQ